VLGNEPATPRNQPAPRKLSIFQAHSEVWQYEAVILPPVFDHLLGVFQRQEPVLVQALLPELPIELLDERIICGLSWPAEVELNAIEVGPPIQRLRDEFRSVVYTDRARQAPFGGEPLQT
jgi:hypothetical protein